MDYDETVFSLFGGQEKYEESVEKLVEFAEIRKGESVLELCCGTGISTRHILQKTRKVTAVELNSERMQLARQHLPPQVKLLTQDALYLNPERHGRYDLILCINGFHYTKKPRKLHV